MNSNKSLYRGVAAAGIAAVLAACAAQMDKPQPADEAIHVGAADLGGVVNSAKGPEAGVWVIAETTDLPTKFARIVVTDERGRYLMPDLPQATYSVWVRGYRLVDCQQETAHLERFGAEPVPRRRFLRELQRTLAQSAEFPRAGTRTARPQAL